MSKAKKQTPQQAFNQFIFDGMMDKLRAVELYEKEVAGFSNQISQHIKDHREWSAKVEPIINDLIKKVDALVEKHNGICTQKATEDWLNNLSSHQDAQDARIRELEEANAALWEKSTEQDEGINSMLKALPDIEILKTQMAEIMPGEKGNLWYRVVELERNKANAISLSGLAGDEIRGRIKELEKQLASLQMGAMEHKIEKPKKTCATCKNGLLDGSSCTLFNTRCINHRLWCKGKPSGRPKKGA